jgi:hypothetical protein
MKKKRDLEAETLIEQLQFHLMWDYSISIHG